MFYYVEVHAPMDQTFVGPFGTSGLAQQFANVVRERYGFNCFVASQDGMLTSIRYFGAIPIQSPSIN